MRKLTGTVFGICLALAPQIAAAADHTGDPNWIKDFSSGCWLYNAQPQHDEAVAWEGPACPYGGEASGEGTVTWFQYNSWTLAEKGEMRDGLMQGPWIRRFKSGEVEESNWVDGVRQQETTADQGGDDDGGQGGGSSYTPVYDGDAYMETLKRQNRENCERAAKGANIICNPE